MTTPKEALTCREWVPNGVPEDGPHAVPCGQPVEWVYPWHFSMKQGYAGPKRRTLHHLNRVLDEDHEARQ